MSARTVVAMMAVLAAMASPQATIAQSFAPLIDGKPLPLLGLVAFVDTNWSDKMSTTIGYSRLDIDTTDAQGGQAFEVGQYALANVMFYPVKNVMFGPELQWGKRENQNGFTSDDVRIQFTVKYNFATTFGGK